MIKFIKRVKTVITVQKVSRYKLTSMRIFIERSNEKIHSALNFARAHFLKRLIEFHEEPRGSFFNLEPLERALKQGRHELQTALQRLRFIRYVYRQQPFDYADQ